MRPAIAALSALLASTAIAQTPTPIDAGDVVVDAAGSSRPGLGANAHGEFVVVWSEGGIQGQRFAADGAAVGGAFTVASPGAYPSVAVADSGAFMVVWRANESGMWRVKKRFYAANNVPTAAADVDADSNVLLWGDVAADAAGNFVVVWAEDATGSYDFDVKSRRFDSTGGPAAAEQLVSSGTAADRNPRIAYSAGEQGFIVVWDREAASNLDVRARLLDSSGIPISTDFPVNSYTTAGQFNPDVSRSREGSFTVVWNGVGSGDDSGIFGQRFDAAGTAVGTQFLVNTYTSSSQQQPRIAMDASANFVVSWLSAGSPGTDNDQTSAQGRAFFADGSALGSQFQANTYTTQQQTTPQVAMLGGGDFVVAWDKNVYIMQTSFLDVRMRRFASTLPLFADGFESTNSQAWSSAVP